LDESSPTPAPAAAPYTTVSNWWGQWVLWQGQTWANDKRTYFMEFADLPRRTSASLELALLLGDGDEGDRAHLERNGWTIRSVLDVCQTPFDYRRYIQRSRGEFSCVKPSCVRLDNAWISDRSVCYLASGKPVVVQYTGASQFLPDACGLFRFRTIEEAAHHLETLEADYERHCREARALAEEYFDARTVLARALELALD
jgi:hypothetical protein